MFKTRLAKAAEIASLLIGLIVVVSFWAESNRTARMPITQQQMRRGPRRYKAHLLWGQHWRARRKNVRLILPALAQKARRAVVLIVCSTESGEVKTGSGFFVSPDGQLVTNYHVVANVVKAQAKVENGAIYNIEGVLSSSSALDLALLKADARDVEFLFVNDTVNSPQPGSRVAVIGGQSAGTGKHID